MTEKPKPSVKRGYEIRARTLKLHIAVSIAGLISWVIICQVVRLMLSTAEVHVPASTVDVPTSTEDVPSVDRSMPVASSPTKAEETPDRNVWRPGFETPFPDDNPKPAEPAPQQHLKTGP